MSFSYKKRRPVGGRSGRVSFFGGFLYLSGEFSCAFLVIDDIFGLI